MGISLHDLCYAPLKREASLFEKPWDCLRMKMFLLGENICGSKIHVNENDLSIPLSMTK